MNGFALPASRGSMRTLRANSSSVLAIVLLVAGACSPGPLPTISPSGSPQSVGPTDPRPSASTDDWEALRRPLTLDRLAPGTACPVSPATSISSTITDVQGDGPVYAADGGGIELREAARNRNGLYDIRILWVSTADYAGPVLVRGQRVDADGAMTFLSSGAELRLPRESDIGWAGKPIGWRGWPSRVLLPDPGCYAWQIDGESFTDVIWVLASTAPA